MMGSFLAGSAPDVVVVVWARAEPVMLRWAASIVKAAVPRKRRRVWVLGSVAVTLGFISDLPVDEGEAVAAAAEQPAAWRQFTQAQPHQADAAVLARDLAQAAATVQTTDRSVHAGHGLPPFVPARVPASTESTLADRRAREHGHPVASAVQLALSEQMSGNRPGAGRPRR